MMRKHRHVLAQRLFWSRPGSWVVELVNRVAPRWNYVVMNRSLDMDVNGERWLVSLLPPDALVLDVGFNRGEFSTMVVKDRPKARCIGFDPAASMSRHYKESYPYKQQVEFVGAAVSSEEGECLFHDSSNGNSRVVAEGCAEDRDSESLHRATQLTLDSFVKRRGISSIDLIKIDAEGFDLHVLEGATGILAKQHASMFLFEYNEPWIATRRFLQEAAVLFERNPYRLFRLFNGFLAPFQYSSRAERHDLGCNYVGISNKRLACGNLAIRDFP